MSTQTTIAVDALGGDFGPSVVLPGVATALESDPQLSVLLCGPADVVEPFAAAHERCEAVPTTQEIAMGEHPARAVRSKKDSSLVVAARLVREERAQGFFSAGSTGACLVAATLVTGRAKGVSRPALATVIPSPVRPVIMCDVGANADCKPEYLVQFAQMGAVYAEHVLGRHDPRVALLNIGAEDTKGSQFAQECHQLLRERVPQFAGNAEGGDVLMATYDVYVTDGFTGNVCLKTIEGTSKALFGAIKDAFKKSPVTMAGAALVKGGLVGLKDQLDPNRVGGAPILGVRGACIVGHGSANERGIGNGIAVAALTSRERVSEIIAQTVAGEDA